MVVSARVGEAVGATRFIIVIQKMRQLRMQNTAIRLTILSAARSLEASALQPDFRILWNVSIFQRIAYQASFSNASLRDRTERFVISFQRSLRGLSAWSAPERESPSAAGRGISSACRSAAESEVVGIGPLPSPPT